VATLAHYVLFNNFVLFRGLPKVVLHTISKSEDIFDSFGPSHMQF